MVLKTCNLAMATLIAYLLIIYLVKIIPWLGRLKKFPSTVVIETIEIVTLLLNSCQKHMPI